jgi:hypothetical protein
VARVVLIVRGGCRGQNRSRASAGVQKDQDSSGAHRSVQRHLGCATPNRGSRSALRTSAGRTARMAAAVPAGLRSTAVIAHAAVVKESRIGRLPASSTSGAVRYVAARRSIPTADPQARSSTHRDGRLRHCQGLRRRRPLPPHGTSVRRALGAPKPADRTCHCTKPVELWVSFEAALPLRVRVSGVTHAWCNAARHIAVASSHRPTRSLNRKDRQFLSAMARRSG